ncbi:hypothetical protein J9P59_003078 [Salmonella enterica]|nr:hypothetical protein [Salmonella enterica]
MPVRASIEPLLWENTFFGVNSGIVRIDASAPELTPEALQAWQRVQVKVPAENIAWLSALQSLGFSLVEGEVDFALPVKGHRDQHGAEIAHLTDIPALRQLAGEAFTQSRGKATLRVATQLGNTAALKRYIQSGANIESTAYWLYR